MGQKDIATQQSFAQALREPEESGIECLGVKFKCDAERRDYFTARLKDKLQDPSFRRTAGFPIGSDEDILRVSDPPYYTACPNPFVRDFVRQYGKPYQPDGAYRREPFAADVSEGKNDSIYNAHAYHTKVPHKAIMRYVLHYTEPGDIVFDGFCGTGMAGVAAQLCGERAQIESIGYVVGSDGSVLDSTQNVIARSGPRIPVLNDLSPAATLIAAGYNLTADPRRFGQEAKALLDAFSAEYGWMYQTRDSSTGELCAIDFTVWSEIFSCPECSGEIDYWHLAYDDESGEIAEAFNCPHCSLEVSKRDLVRRTTTFFDKALQRSRTRQVLRPVEIRYTHKGKERRKQPDSHDLAIIERAAKLLDSLEYPTELMMFVPEGQEWGDLYRGYHEGISRVHDFFLPRQLAAFSILWQLGNRLLSEEEKRLWRFTLQSIVVSFTRRNRFLKNAYSQVNRALSGTLYIGSTVSEPSPTYVLSGKIKRFAGAIPKNISPTLITTGSLAQIDVPDDSVDYVFIDPPFGDNLPYAELNFLWEAWLRVFSNAKQDAVVSGTQRKDLSVYTEMMTARVSCA